MVRLLVWWDAGDRLTPFSAALAERKGLLRQALAISVAFW